MGGICFCRWELTRRESNSLCLHCNPVTFGEGMEHKGAFDMPIRPVISTEPQFSGSFIYTYYIFYIILYYFLYVYIYI